MYSKLKDCMHSPFCTQYRVNPTATTGYCHGYGTVERPQYEQQCLANIIYD